MQRLRKYRDEFFGWLDARIQEALAGKTGQQVDVGQEPSTFRRGFLVCRPEACSSLTSGIAASTSMRTPSSGTS
jgi:hypothetical protein